MNIFNNSVIEESILNIKLPKTPFIYDRNRKHNTDSGSFDNQTKSVNVVKIRNLSITFDNKMSLEMLDGSILEPTILLLAGRGTKVQVSFCCKKLEFLHPWQQLKQDF